MAVLEKEIDRERGRGNIATDESRVFWLCILQAVVMIKSAIVKRLKLDARCEHCGNKL